MLGPAETGEQGPLAQGDRMGPYEVIDWLGSGGTAAVYRARHRERQSLHALKVLIVDRPSLRKRLLTEGYVQANLCHPNLVSVTDIVLGKSLALVLEYIAGPSLDRILADRRLTLEEVDVLIRGILRGVAHAHAAGVVHRDIKPANVLLALSDGLVVPKVTDFGLVKLVTPEAASPRTFVGQAMGTPAYMPPEQYTDASSIDARADVWSLGVLMYELCTGQLPFDEASPGETLRKSAAAHFVPPQVHVPNLPSRMIDAIVGALKVDASARICDVALLNEIWSGDARAPSQRLPLRRTGTCKPEVRNDFAMAVARGVRAAPLLAPMPDPPHRSPWFWGLALSLAVGLVVAAAAVGTVLGAAVGAVLQA